MLSRIEETHIPHSPTISESGKISGKNKFIEISLYILQDSFLKTTLLLILLYQTAYYPQTDWVRWEESSPDFRIKGTQIEREPDPEISSLTDVLTKPAVYAYRILISDVDGANCPFHPSCSQFLLESIEQTGVFQGTLMFFDRFTRDANFVNRSNRYPKYGKHHFYDPVSIYTLNKEEIIYIPPDYYTNQ